MDAELKSKWVTALRSGKYKQGQTFLYSSKDESFCCLGVLCEVEGIPRSAFVGRCTTTIEWFDCGLTPKQTSFLGDTMNDQERIPFPEIADYIEKNL